MILNSLGPTQCRPPGGGPKLDRGEGIQFRVTTDMGGAGAGITEKRHSSGVTTDLGGGQGRNNGKTSLTHTGSQLTWEGAGAGITEKRHSHTQGHN